MIAKLFSVNKKLKARDSMLDGSKIDPVFRRKVHAVLLDMRGQGYPLVVVETIRSKARGALMKLTGKSGNGSKSAHCKIPCKAVDCAFDNGKGGITWDVPASWWQKYGQCAESHDLTWGGRWKMRDYNHIQLD
jgi:peptidoglycan L-alanyl-D-glutamate endopeptidase CwlK